MNQGSPEPLPIQVLVDLCLAPYCYYRIPRGGPGNPARIEPSPATLRLMA